LIHFYKRFQMSKNRMRLGLRMSGFLLSGVLLVAVVEAESVLPTVVSSSTHDSSSESGPTAQHATMTKEELKLVKLLLKVQESYPNLKPEEQSKLVSKVQIFAEKLDQTLTKADSIPGKYGLDVEVLRKNLKTGPSLTLTSESEAVVEDEEDYQDEELEDDDDEEEEEDDSERSSSPYDGLPEDMDLDQAIELIRDLSQEVRLLSYMIMTLGGAPHTHAMPTYPHHHMPGGFPMAGYQHPLPQHHQQSVYATPYQAKAAKVGRKAVKRAMKVNAQMSKGSSHSETKKHLESILEAIPDHYQDVDVNLNYIKKK